MDSKFTKLSVFILNAPQKPRYRLFTLQGLHCNDRYGIISINLSTPQESTTRMVNFAQENA